MRILFAHTNFPAQFGALGEWLAGEGWEVTFLTQRAEAKNPHMRVVVCKDHREPSQAIHPYLRTLEKAVITGQAFARAAVRLRRDGYRPDIVVAHSGWGAGPFTKDVWPEAAFVPYFEWYYRYPNVDRTPYDQPTDPLEGKARNRVRNAPFWLDFSSADRALCPTRFQAAQFPTFMRANMTVLHDGVDTDLHAPGPGARPALLAAHGLPGDAEILTSITRGMEPHRGFPDTMRAIARLHKTRPKLHAFVGGEDRVAYGAKLPEGESWKKRMLAELDLDHDRLHFTGLVPRQQMIDLMRASDVHLYLTVPFVLSWSLLDAMAVGCLIVASDTEPVREFVTDGATGLLTPMGDVDALVARIEAALDDKAALAGVRAAARRRTVEELDAARIIYPKKKAFFQAVVEAARGQISPPAMAAI